MVPVIPDPELLLYELGDAFRGPEVGGLAVPESAFDEHPLESLRVNTGEPGGISR